VMSDSTEIVDYEKMMRELAKKATATERPSSGTINVKSGILSVNGDPVKGNKLDVIFVSSTQANLYYEEKWNPDDPKNPVCFAYSEDGEDMKPHPASSKPQHHECATCPMNQWRSEEISKAEIAILALPVTSVKEWSNYVNLIAATFGRPPLGMVTQLGVEPHIKHQFHVKFDPKAPVDVSYIKALIDKAATCKDLLEKVYDPNPEPKAGDDSGKTTGKSKKF
jgi:hypothetical protein